MGLLALAFGLVIAGCGQRLDDRGKADERDLLAGQPPGPRGDMVDAGLVAHLVKPYWRWSADRWRLQCERMRESRRFDLAARDARFSRVARVIAESPQRSQARVLVIENVSGDPESQYWSVGLYRRGIDAAVDSQLAGLEMRGVSQVRWQGIEESARDLLAIGGCNHGGEIVYDDADATVLSYFDGVRWRVETWFMMAYVEHHGQTVPAINELRPETRAAVRLLERLVLAVDPPPRFGGDRYWGLVTLYGSDEVASRLR